MKSKTVIMLVLVAVLGVIVTFGGTVMGAIIPGGDFQMYKPGTGYTVTATFPGAPLDNYAQQVGDDLFVRIANGDPGVADYSDGTTGSVVDLPGWVVIQGNNDLGSNGVDGSTGINVFAAWGGDCRRETAGSLGTIELGNVITISAMVNGGVDGPIAGPLAFYLLAGGVQLTPSSSVDVGTPTGDWQEISRTFDAAALADHIGKSMSIVIGVQDENDINDRMIWDNVSMVVPEPATMALLALGGLGLIRRRRNR